MCENSNYSQNMALRREIRQRKILENSANRLKLIEGVNSSFTKTSEYSDFTNEPKRTEPYFKREFLFNESFSYSKPETNSEFSDLFEENKELKLISNYLSINQEDKEKEKKEEIMVEFETKNHYLGLIIQKRLHYVFLAVAVNILLFFNLGFLFYENILCPFSSVKLIEFIKKREMKEDLQLFLILFVNNLPKHLQKSTKIIFNLVPEIFSDLFLYLFTFIMCNKIFNTDI